MASVYLQFDSQSVLFAESVVVGALQFAFHMAPREYDGAAQHNSDALKSWWRDRVQGAGLFVVDLHKEIIDNGLSWQMFRAIVENAEASLAGNTGLLEPTLCGKLFSRIGWENNLCSIDDMLEFYRIVLSRYPENLD